MHQSRKFDTCFFERYAQISLATLLGDKYASLVNKDRPDLQDIKQSLGIEVTRAIRENKNVAHQLINEIAGKPITDVENDDFKDIRKNGYGYGLDNEGWIGSLEYNYWALALPLQRIIDSKVHKVIDGFYGDFAEFDLYIFAKENVEETDVTTAMNHINTIQQGQKRHYTKMFISQIHSLYVCDLETNRFSNIPIDKPMRRNFYNLALPS